MIWGAEKGEAMKLRLKGFSYNEIQKELGIPKSTLRSWFGEMILPDKARERLASRIKFGTAYLIKRNKMQTHKAWQIAKGIQTKAMNEISELSRNELLLLGTALYWAEGYKRTKIREGKKRPGHPISFVNSDADMVRFFIRFLKEVLGVPVESIKANMRLYDHMNEEQMRAYWMHVTDLPLTRFGKTTRLVSISSQRKKKFNILPHGTIQIEVYDTEKFHHIIGWIKGMKKHI